MSSGDEQKEKSKYFYFKILVKQLLEELFSIPLVQNYNQRFNELGEELDIVKMGLWDVQQISKKI